MNRPLTADERGLVRWLLEHGSPGAQKLLPQLELAQVAPTRCPCGCASINFLIAGHAPPLGGMNIIADFIFGSDDELNGVFVFEQNGVLSGLEVVGYAGDAPKHLPSPKDLRPIEAALNDDIA